MKQRVLSPVVMAGLDAARAAAAFYVVIHHVANAYGMSHGPGLLFRFGQEAVLIFFLLSGFVIFANERTRALHPRGYYLRRLRRIYPPLLVAMAVSTAVALDNGDFATRFSVGELLGTLASLQDISVLKPGVIVDPYLGNDPLWSLSYELLFYLIFPAILIGWTRRPAMTGHLIGLSCCVCYVAFALAPNHFTLVGAYFLVWWAGAMAARAYVEGRRNVLGIGSAFAWVVVLCAIAAAVVVIEGRGRGIGFYPVLPLRHFAVGAVMLAVFFGPVGAFIARRLSGGARVFTAIASISYGVYVLHYPLLVDWQRAQGAVGLMLGGVLLVALAWLVELRLPRLLPRAPAD